MAALDDLTAAVAAETTVMQGAETLLGTLSDKLAAANAAGDSGAIEQIVTQMKTNAAALSAALVANTPAAASTGVTTPTSPGADTADQAAASTIGTTPVSSGAVASTSDPAAVPNGGTATS